jgi:competence protein ComEC
MKALLRLTAVLALLALLAPAALAQPPRRWRPDGRLHVYVLDIGQGDSTLIVSPTGKTVLIDTGDAGRDELVLGALDLFAGGRRVDLFVASHAHQDHIGEADTVIRGARVERILDSGYPDGSSNYTSRTLERYLQAAVDRRVPVTKAEPGQTFDLGGGARITVIAPSRPYFRKADLGGGSDTPNANSVVLRLDHGNFSMLFTGDAEAETEARLLGQGDRSRLRAKVLKVAHHGSLAASSAEFLRAVRPDVATISAGATNCYGHPSPEALRRLRESGARVYRTDLHGQIRITSDGSRYRLTTEKLASPAAVARGRRPCPRRR